MSELLERGADVARLGRAIQSATGGRGGVAVIEGPPGIGKTRLGEEAAALARAAGMTVVEACGSELEREFGFGAARQLFEPVLVERAGGGALLDGAARLAAPALGLDGGDAPGAGGDAGFPVIHGLYWAAANLAAERPLLIWVDDLQWVDQSSQRFLAYLGRRLSGLPAVLVVGVRPAVPGEERASVDAIAGTRGALLLHPAPLSVDAVGSLAERRLGSAPTREFAVACRRVTGGNALLVHDLLTELVDVGDEGAATELEAIGMQRIGRGIGRRLASLPAAATALADAVTVLGDGCSLEVAATLAGLDVEDAARCAEALVAADVLAHDATLRFRHPVVRAAVRDRRPPLAMAAAHGRAAGILLARGAPPAAVAAHLVASSPAGEQRTVDVLREAARQAMRQGASDVAASHLARALREPPADALRADVLLELSGAEQAAGLPGAADHIREAIPLIGDAADRAGAGLRLATGLAERQRWPEAAQSARSALADLDGADRELSLMLQAILADCVRMDPAAGGDEANQLRQLAGTLSGATPGERLVLATAAVLTPADTAAEHAAAAELLDRSLVLDPLLPGRVETGIVSNFIRAGQLERAETVVERVMAEARAGGLVHRYALMLSMRGWIALERGALVAAEEDLREALELGEDVAAIAPAPIAAMLAVVLAEREPAKAGQVLEQHGVGGQLPEHQVMNLTLSFRARVRLAQGRADDALADALEVGRRYARFGLRRAVPPWRSLAAVLLAGRDEPERAAELAEEELELAGRWDTPLAVGLALRGLGLVKGDPGLLRRAVETLEGTPWRLDLARSQVDLGAALRRSGSRQAARSPLREGMDLAHACGAKLLAERARTELLATGARPRRLALSGAGALTPSERRVAELAASGRTNRQIAEDLFVTTSTVETHLRHAYPKLGLRSRDGLAEALADSFG